MKVGFDLFKLCAFTQERFVFNDFLMKKEGGHLSEGGEHLSEGGEHLSEWGERLSEGGEFKQRGYLHV